MEATPTVMEATPTVMEAALAVMEAAQASTEAAPVVMEAAPAPISLVEGVARNGGAAAAPVVVEAASNAVEATINMGVSVRNMNIENVGITVGLIRKSQKKQGRKRGQILRDRASN